MVIGHDPEELIRYIAIDDLVAINVAKSKEEEPPEPTVFLLKLLPMGFHARVVEKFDLIGISDKQVAPGSIEREFVPILKHGLAGWENFKVRRSGDLVAVDFEKGDDGLASDRSIGLLPFRIRVELVRAIVTGQTPTYDDQLKS